MCVSRICSNHTRSIINSQMSLCLVYLTRRCSVSFINHGPKSTPSFSFLPRCCCLLGAAGEIVSLSAVSDEIFLHSGV